MLSHRPGSGALGEDLGHGQAQRGKLDLIHSGEWGSVKSCLGKLQTKQISEWFRCYSGIDLGAAWEGKWVKLCGQPQPLCLQSSV